MRVFDPPSWWREVADGLRLLRSPTCCGQMRRVDILPKNRHLPFLFHPSESSTKARVHLWCLLVEIPEHVGGHDCVSQCVRGAQLDFRDLKWRQTMSVTKYWTPRSGKLTIVHEKVRMLKWQASVCRACVQIQTRAKGFTTTMLAHEGFPRRLMHAIPARTQLFTMSILQVWRIEWSIASQFVL